MDLPAALLHLEDLRHTADWARWQKLAHHEAPFLEPDFFALVRPLAGEGKPYVAETWSETGLVGALPLMLEGDVLRALRCDHTPEFNYIGDRTGIEAIWQMLRRDGRWNELILDKVPARSPLAIVLPALATIDKSPVVVTEDSRHRYMQLPDFAAQLHPKFRSNLQRCARKARDLVLERIAIPTREDLDDAYAIEARAWKGAAGTAIASDATVDHLYRALARVFGRRGRSSLYFLRVGGVRIATLFAIESGHTLYALKIGYDPAHANLSPGHLLVWQVAADAEARGLKELDFVGRDDEWKRKWTERVHEHVKIVIYRRSLRGLSRYALREFVRPRLPEPLRTTPRSPLPRRCQHADVVGHSTLSQRVHARITRGLGVKAGVRRLLSGKLGPIGLGRASQFPVGSWVRVRDIAALRATLGPTDKLRGLILVPTQLATAGKVYEVEAHVRRLRDDRGMFRAVDGTVRLHGVDCGGAGPEPAGCGRHCPLMYRDEWLEAAPAPHHAPTPAHAVRHARVRDLDEIYAGLDAFGRRDGVTFMPEMAAYAGQRFPVASEVSRVFELDRWTILSRPLCVLDGLHCTGKVLGPQGPCDRACALMWHRDWLMLDLEVTAAVAPTP